MAQEPPSENYYSHLVFDNSRTQEFYFYSRGRVTAPSSLKTIRGKLPVAGGRFCSPPNSLELAWCSRTGGDWSAEIEVEPWRGRDMRLLGDRLTFWCYAENAIPGDCLPVLTLSLRARRGRMGLRLAEIMADLPAGRWTLVEAPFEAFPAKTSEVDFSQLRAVIFEQGIDDGEPHALYVDEIKISAPRGDSPVAPPAGVTARGYDQHVEVQWTPAADPEVEYVLIARSEDGKHFEPVGIQNPTFSRYTDFVSGAHGTYHYRVSAVNRAYRESDAAAASAATRPFDDDDLLTMVQEACFRYYWEHAHPDAGLALECIPGEEHLIALGASGFGLMALLVAAERGFVTRAAAADHMIKALVFLDGADRFHGVWPHFLDGRTGKTIPWFGKYDNGGDLVETAFMIQSLLAARQYFSADTPEEQGIRRTITRLWESVEWDWYRNPAAPEFLFWHWSPDHGWHINHPLIGWNETMIAYLLAIASPTHPVPASLYYSGWASQSERAQKYRQDWGKTTDGDHYANGHTYYGLPLPVGVGPGGPLFFTHYSFLGFDPRGKRDRYANYFENNRAISLIHYRHGVENPGGYAGYGADFWGLSASDDHTGYAPHDPMARNDNGTITPTGALSAFPYTPDESMRALKHLYYARGAALWDIYGFRDACNPTVNYVSPIFMGLNQAPVVVMIENQRTGLPWKLFMANPEIPAMLDRIGFVAEA